MELPRYQSRTLPTVAAESPASAGAGAGAMGQALARGADVVADVTTMIGRAEGEAAAGAALADLQVELTEFTGDPRWQQPELDGRPTADVLKEEWERKQRELLARKPAIGWRDARNAYEQRRTQLVGQAGVEVIGQQRKLMVDRGKALTDYEAQQYVNAGSYDLARQAYQRGIDSGLYSVAEYVQRTQTLEQTAVEDGYLRRIAPGADGDLAETVTAVLGDARLPPARRNVLARTISAEAERRERETSAVLQRGRQETAAFAWSNIDALSIADIARLNVDPEDRTALFKAKRSALLDGEDRPSGVIAVSRALGDVAAGRETRGNALAAIQRARDAGEISEQTARKAREDVAGAAAAAFRDPVRDQLVSLGARSLNKGVPSDQILTMFKAQEASERAALALEWERDFTAAALRAGPGFDAQRWYEQNLPRYLKRSEAIADTTTGSYDYLRVPKDKGQPAGPTNMDVAATRAAIQKQRQANGWSPAKVEEIYRELGLTD